MFDMGETKRRLRSCHVPNVMNRIKSIFRPESKIVATAAPPSVATSSSSASAHSIDDSPPASYASPDSPPALSDSAPSPAMSIDSGSIGPSTVGSPTTLSPPTSPLLTKSFLTPPSTPKNLLMTMDYSYEEEPSVVVEVAPPLVASPVPLPTPMDEPPPTTLELFQRCSTMLHKNLNNMAAIQNRIDDRLKLQREVANLKREVARLKELNETAKEELKAWHDIIAKQEVD